MIITNKNPGPGTYFGPINDEWLQVIAKGLLRERINAKHILKVPRFFEKYMSDRIQEVTCLLTRFQ